MQPPANYQLPPRPLTHEGGRGREHGPQGLMLSPEHFIHAFPHEPFGHLLIAPKNQAQNDNRWPLVKQPSQKLLFHYTPPPARTGVLIGPTADLRLHTCGDIVHADDVHVPIVRFEVHVSFAGADFAAPPS